MICPFCEIVEKNSERIIRQTKSIFIVLSNPRLVSGHVLIIPKRHVEKFGELTKSEQKELFDEAIKIQELILSKVSSGCDLSQHFRPFIKQNKLKVNHLHIHLRPREFEDELYKKVQKYEKEVFKDLDEKEFNKYKRILAK